MDQMSKTHWVAVAYLVAKALETGGLIPPGMADAVNTILTGLLGLTVGHRVLKVAGIATAK